MDTPNTENRNEVIRLDSRTIFLIAILLAAALAFGGVYRLHHAKMFVLARDGQGAYKQLIQEEHDVKESLVHDEGVKNWGDTSYAKLHPELPKMAGEAVMP